MYGCCVGATGECVFTHLAALLLRHGGFTVISSRTVSLKDHTLCWVTARIWWHKQTHIHAQKNKNKNMFCFLLNPNLKKLLKKQQRNVNKCWGHALHVISGESNEWHCINFSIRLISRFVLHDLHLTYSLLVNHSFPYAVLHREREK